MLEACRHSYGEGGVDFRWLSINQIDIFSIKPIKEKI